MRRVVSVCLGALACLFVIGVSHALAQTDTTTTTAVTTTTTAAPDRPTTTSSSTTIKTTTTTAKTSASTTVAPNGGRPVPPPAAGPTQTLVPDLLGTPVELDTTTTLTPPTTFTPFNQGSLPTNLTTPISSRSDSPSGLTLILAAIAWLASFGGLLVYVEEKRSSRWKHLAR